MKSLIALFICTMAIVSCGKKHRPNPTKMASFIMTTPDQSLSLTAMKDTTMGIAGCTAGDRHEQVGTAQQQMALPNDTTGCYGYLSSFAYKGDFYASDDMAPAVFAKGQSVHFFSKEVNKLFKVTVENQLGPDSTTVAFTLRKARYIKFFPYDKLPLAEPSRIGAGEEGLIPLRLDRVTYRGLTATGTPKFSIETSCEVGENTARCAKMDITALRFAIVSHNEPHSNLEQLQKTLTTLGEGDLHEFPAQPRAKLGRRLVFSKNDFAAAGQRSRIASSRRYVLILAYKDAYQISSFPLPTISYGKNAKAKARKTKATKATAAKNANAPTAKAAGALNTKAKGTKAAKTGSARHSL